MKMSRSHRIKKSGQEFGREDWDFNPCPAEELRFCWVYEYMREVKGAQRVVAEWRSKAWAQTFEGFCALAKKEGAPSVCVPGDAFHYFPEWPVMAYLSIEQLERNRRYKELYPMRESEYAASLLTPELPQDEWGRDMLMNELYSTAKDGGIPTASVLAFEGAKFVLLQIDWHLTNKALMESFCAFLETRPPEVRERPKKDGKGSHPAILKADLKALGALRLERTMRVSDIPGYTKEVLNAPLYSQDTSILGAVSRAQAVIRSFED
jgi:hypothetical protein